MLSFCRNKERLQFYINEYYLDYKEAFTSMQSSIYVRGNGKEWIYDKVLQKININSKSEMDSDRLKLILELSIIDFFKDIFDEQENVLGLGDRYGELSSQISAIFGAINQIAKNEVYKKAWDNLEAKVGKIISAINLDELRVDCKAIDETRKKFAGIYKGVSYTKAERFETILRRYYDEEKGEDDYAIDLESYTKIYNACAALATNWQVWYGRAEAQALLNKLSECYFILDLGLEDKKYLHMWALYQQAATENYIGYIQDASIVKEFIRMIEEGQMANKEKVENEALAILNDETIDMKYIENLFKDEEKND